MKFLIITVVFLIHLIQLIEGHGMIMDPINRGSRWRIDSSARPDYNDMQTDCGGIQTQYNMYNGKCGMCGDTFGDNKPRAHELGGTYGQGVSVKTYNRGSTINVLVKITANHKGKFVFKICNLDKEIESEECFDRQPVRLQNGQDYVLVASNPGDFVVPIVLPKDLQCKRCVLQWTYITGNNWGYCSDGTGRLGCGPQEHFRTCSDITIL
ncbi:unnamed protein product [Diamesa serratosioi]